MELKQQLSAITNARFGCGPEGCTDAQLYQALLTLTQQLAAGRPAPKGPRKLYYFSAEFLMGKLLSNNLLALGLFEPVRALLDAMGRSLSPGPSPSPSLLSAVCPLPSALCPLSLP